MRLHPVAVPALIAVLLGLAAPCQSADKLPPEQRAAAVAPAIDAQTVAVGYVDLTRVNVKEVFEQIATRAKLLKEVIGEPQAEVSRRVEAFRKAGATELFVIYSLADMPREWPVLALPVPKGANEAELQSALQQASEGSQAKRIGDLIVAGSEAAIARISAKQADPRPELAASFSASADSPLQIHFTLSKEQRKIISETLQGLPAEFGSEPGRIIAESLRSATVTADKPGLTSWKVNVQAIDADGAARLRKLALSGLELLKKDQATRQRMPQIEKLTSLLTPKVEGNRLTASLTDDNQGTTLLAELVVPPITRSYDRLRRRRTMEHMKEIGLAMHNYHDAYKHFPPAALRDKQNRPLLSWRVLLLPYLDPKLYKEFDLDEAWDGPHNKKLIGRMPPMYRSPASRITKPGYTTCLVAVGPNTLFSKPEGMTIKEVTDGTSATIMTLDANDDAAVIWTKPDDWEFDPKRPWRNLIGHHADGFVCGLADGAALFLGKERTSDKTLKALMTANAGDTPGW